MNQLEEPKKETTVEKNNKEKIERIRTVTNQYFLRSINNRARSWPYLKKRRSKQQNIVGDRDKSRRYLLKGLEKI